MSDYIRRLKLCIKWFQQLEGNYVTEQASLSGMLESAEKKCNEMGMVVLQQYEFVPWNEFQTYIAFSFCFRGGNECQRGRVEFDHHGVEKKY